MFKLYFIRELRSLLKNKYISVLKISGLIIGLWVFMAASYYVLHETNFDSFQDSAGNKFSMEARDKFGESYFQFPLPYVLCESLSDRYPEVVKNTSFDSKNTAIFIKQENNLIKSDYTEIGFVEENFFDFFSFNFIAGNAEESLKAPNPLIISENIATKRFGKLDVIGTPVSLIINDQLIDFTITGIIKNPASNSNVSYHWIGSLSHFMQAQGKKDYKSDWNYQCKNFIQLAPESDISDFTAKLTQDYIRLAKLEKSPTLLLTELNKIHVNMRLKIFITLGVLILLISIINYVLLSTIEKTQQMRLWGIEKISGAKKFHLFLKNSISVFIFSVIAFVITFGLFKLTQPYFPNFVGSDTPFNAILNTKKIVTGALLCSFSIIFLSSFINQLISGNIKPIEILQNRLSKGKAGKILFNSLLTFQLMAFIALISASMLVRKQLSFMQEGDLGFNKESLISMNIAPKDVHSYPVFKEELLKNPNVRNVAGTNNLPLSKMGNIYGEVYTDSLGNQQMRATEFINVDKDFFNTMEIKFSQGNGFKENVENQCIVNQTLLDERGVKDPLNETIKLGGKEYQISGVIEDFHNKSMQMSIQPFVAHYSPDNISHAIVRFSGNPSEIIELMRKTATTYLSNTIFEYEFFDQRIAAAYKTETKFSNIINLLTTLSIFIAVLGLLGVSYFSSLLRIKEIGIRKVNGAKISEVLMMLNKDFVKWVGIGFLVATPIAYYATNKWLENFAYKTSLSWWIFALAGVLAMSIALLTVSWQSWRAATRNPVEALRYE
ncbi:ABC transporter permease [Maribellus maritimus]|uniref:ABC transporter permease n=1 Tax=Maribellus maritimus TaxID=2870838 RepID=UPI001EECDF98|nr:ABC transporter permease [Maribellus maritimus]MCG6188031.1 ABC transporter permease [Maribellus maritimus]